MKKLFDRINSATGMRWIAVTVLLLAYVLVSWNIVQGSSVVYQLINVAGSTLMIGSCLKMKPKDWAVASFNLVWILVAIFTLAHIIRLF